MESPALSSVYLRLYHVFFIRNNGVNTTASDAAALGRSSLGMRPSIKRSLNFLQAFELVWAYSAYMKDRHRYSASHQRVA